MMSKSVLRYERTPYGKQIRKDYEQGNIKEKRSNMRQLKPRDDGISNTLTTVQKDNLLLEVDEVAERQGDDDISNNIDTSKYRVRRLTPKESWRLMAFDDEDFEKARKAMNDNIYNGKDRSSSQLYKTAGNSIVVDVLFYIYSNLYDVMPYLFENMVLGSFFSGIGALERAFSRLNVDGEITDAVSSQQVDANDEPKLEQIGHINNSNSAANRVYNDKIATTLKANAGGGGAKTGWYKVKA